MSPSTAMSYVTSVTDPYIMLKVKDQLTNIYCDRCAMNLISIGFLFDERRLQGKQTLDELEMEDGDEIDALLH
ncbi:hypothetical protein ACJIZ3_019665 [Penstemon smallii]|uniref:Rad60/SUMO-like domain-containing protein n=1 Tax=Penstemon smallii TaxID=265156 RepID=A0ABD3T320_9LAMI